MLANVCVIFHESFLWHLLKDVFKDQINSQQPKQNHEALFSGGYHVAEEQRGGRFLGGKRALKHRLAGVQVLH